MAEERAPADAGRLDGERTLRGRLYRLLGQWLFVFFVVSGAIGLFALHQMREHVEQDRLLLARTVAHHLDSTLLNALQGAEQLVAELPAPEAWGGSEVRSDLRAFRFQLPFRQAIHLVDGAGEVLVSDPRFARPPPGEWLAAGGVGRPRVSPLLDREGRGVLLLVVPFTRREPLEGAETGVRVRPYLLVAEMNPRGSLVSVLLQDLAPEPDLQLVVVDAAGSVLAAPDHGQLFERVEPAGAVGASILDREPLVTEAAVCTICGEAPRAGDYLTVVVPLEHAPWGVVAQQDQRAAFSVLRPSQVGFGATTVLLVLMALLLSRGLDRSVVAPVDQLSAQAERLHRGDLVTPIRVAGDREIQILAGSLDAARSRLGETLGELEALNEHLEQLVADRTRALRSRYQDLELLYDVVALCAQEWRAERFVPPVLQRISRHLSFHAVALVVTPVPEEGGVHGLAGERYVHPEKTVLPWLAADATPPAGWQRRELLDRDVRQGVLFYRWAETEEAGAAPVMGALCHELALSLRSARQLRRLVVQDAERKLLVRRLLGAAEEERRRIARELHDEIAQLLTAVQLGLDAACRAEAARAREDGRPGWAPPAALERVDRLLVRTQEEIHRVIFDLRPSLLDDLGLPAAVRWYAEQALEPAGLEVSLDMEELPPLAPEVEITAFRIYQEIVTNILRHARAEHVSVELGLGRDGARLVLAVEDDGVGFDPAPRRELTAPEGGLAASGAGLVGMRERAGLVGGRLEIDSEPGLGAHVRLEIPLGLSGPRGDRP